MSQVNLGRLFLLGEGDVPRDREAGRRLLTRAAEHGDCDAQMVVGMIHATPAFECYDLALSEYWLKRSLAGGKADAERLLQRVQQQMGNAQLPSIEGTVPCQSQTSHAAKQRGDDYRRHGLLKAAAIEYQKAFGIEYTRISHLADHLEVTVVIGNHEQCLLDSLHEMALLNSEGTNMLGNKVNSRMDGGLSGIPPNIIPSGIHNSVAGTAGFPVSGTGKMTHPLICAVDALVSSAVESISDPIHTNATTGAGASIADRGDEEGIVKEKHTAEMGISVSAIQANSSNELTPLPPLPDVPRRLSIDGVDVRITSSHADEDQRPVVEGGSGAESAVSVSKPASQIQSLFRIYDAIAYSLVEVNPSGSMAMDFFEDTFLRAHRSALIGRILREMLVTSSHGLKALILVLR